MPWAQGPLKRFKRLAKLLNQLQLDVAIITDQKNVSYYTGYASQALLPVTSYLLALRDAEPILLTGNTEVSVAEKTFGGQIATYENYHLKRRMVGYLDVIEKAARKIIANKRKIRKIGIEFWTHPHGLLDLRGRVRLLDLSTKILNQRMVKDSDEIEAVRKSCELNDIAYGVIKKNCVDGNTEIGAYAEAYRELITKANSSTFQFFYGDFTSGERSLSGGAGPPTERVMRHGETLVLDLSATTRGYFGDTCRTFVIDGTPTERQRQTLGLLKKALVAGEEQLRPGATGGEAYRAMHDVIAEAGYGDKFPHHGGHGLGLDVWEPPFIIPGCKQKLRNGTVIALEPGVYIPDVGGMRIENNYLIKSGSVESLSRFPLEL